MSIIESSLIFCHCRTEVAKQFVKICNDGLGFGSAHTDFMLHCNFEFTFDSSTDLIRIK